MAKRAKEKKFFRWLFSLRLFSFILDEGLPHNFDYVVKKKKERKNHEKNFITYT
jgi:hypothetical protein